MVKVSININSEVRNNYIAIIEKTPSFKVNGHYSVNNLNEFIASFWVDNETGVHVSELSRLGMGSFDVLDADGNLVVGFSETNISPNAYGVYFITPMTNVNPASIILYTARVTVVVDGIQRTTLIPVVTPNIEYETKAQFSINALNQFQGTLWLQGVGSTPHVINDMTLGTASYTVYDKDGTAVVGLTETGIVADVNGMFHITPVSAILLTDLTHYTVSVTINAHAVDHIAYKGFSLLGN